MSSGNTLRMICTTSLSPQLWRGGCVVGGAVGGGGFGAAVVGAGFGAGVDLGAAAAVVAGAAAASAGAASVVAGAAVVGGSDRGRQGAGRGTVAGTVPWSTVGGSGAIVELESLTGSTATAAPGSFPARTTSWPLLRAANAAIGVMITPAAKRTARRTAKGSRVARRARSAGGM